MTLINAISKTIDDANYQLNELKKLESQAASFQNSKQAFFYKDNLVPQMEKLRKTIDTLETLVAKEYWPVPTYTDLLFDE